MRRVEFVPYEFSDSVEIYAIKFQEDMHTELKKFFIKFKDYNDNYLKDDLIRIIKSIEKIALNGALESYFRNEGGVSDRVCAIPLMVSARNKINHGTLRLYCLRLSDNLLIIGGGGLKKSRTYQESAELMQFVSTLQSIDQRLKEFEEAGTDLINDIINLQVIID